MIGLDTNVLVRYILQDDATQAAAAARAIERQCSSASPGFVSQLVLIELIWVLTRGYGYKKADMVAVVAGLLRATELAVEDAADVWTALRAFEIGDADFADYLIGVRGQRAGCEAVLTFDKRATKSQWHEPVV